MTFKITDFEQARVFSDEQLAGRLERTALGSRFVYEPAFLEQCRLRGWGLGFAVPLQAEVVTEGANLHPFFAGLLPEGLRLETLVRTTKTSPDDLFSLLLAAGIETVGDVRVLGIGEKGVVGSASAPLPVVADTDLAQLSFATILAESLDYPRSTERHSIAGVQPKVSARMITLPIRRRNAKRLETAALLKLEPPELPRLIHNEAFFMQVAARCGLAVAPTHLVRDRDAQPGLLVERFDRRAGLPHRLHVEDGCQLLNRYASDKYRVSFQDLLGAIARFASAPALEVVKALELLAFSYLIGNHDLHARNLSLMVSPEGRAHLSPAYDLLSTVPYGDRKLALKARGRDDNLKRRDLLALATQFGAQPRAVSAGLDRIVALLEPWLPRLEEIGFEARKTKALATLIGRRMVDLS